MNAGDFLAEVAEIVYQHDNEDIDEREAARAIVALAAEVKIDEDEVK